MSHPDNPLRQPLGQLLLAQGLVSEDQLRIALQDISTAPSGARWCPVWGTSCRARIHNHGLQPC